MDTSLGSCPNASKRLATNTGAPMPERRANNVGAAEGEELSNFTRARSHHQTCKQPTYFPSRALSAHEFAS